MEGLRVLNGKGKVSKTDVVGGGVRFQVLTTLRRPLNIPYVNSDSPVDPPPCLFGTLFGHRTGSVTGFLTSLGCTVHRDSPLDVPGSL